MDSNYSAGIATELSAPVTELGGIGKKRQVSLEKIGITTVSDLLWHLPRRHEDRRRILSISQIRPPETVTFQGTVITTRLKKPRRNLNILDIVIDDGTGVVFLSFFNQPYLIKAYPKGISVIVWGNVERWGRTLRCSAPEIEKVEEHDVNIHTGRIVPVYPLTSGITQRWLRALIYRLLQPDGADNSEGIRAGAKVDAEDVVPEFLIKKRKLGKRFRAFQCCHFPEDLFEKGRGRTRLAYEELLILQAGLLKKKAEQIQHSGYEIKSSAATEKKFEDALPFELTEYQRKAIREIGADMACKRPMNRLLHGDVGAGKTVVAAWALAMAVYSGFQGAVMAPTEILAEQHIQSFRQFLEPLGITIDILTGNIKAASRKALLQALALGKLDILVGTHALFSQDVDFKKLGLVIIDEQHRFGTGQRSSLIKKGSEPDVLVMTATPIPRTLAITLYGDLEISRVEKAPAGRGAIKTHLRGMPALPRIWNFIKNEICDDGRAYVVCPAIGEDSGPRFEKFHDDSGQGIGRPDAESGDHTGRLSDNKSPSVLVEAVKLHEQLQKGPLQGCRVGLIHGRLDSEDRAAAINAFRDGRIQCIVTTTLIEVGVHVPEATVMVIMNAERYGLSQLHQLRGRIGRGQKMAHCILVISTRDSEARERLQFMVNHNDGFAIAEADLRFRGPGEYYGRRQHGLGDFKVADVLRDTDILDWAREDAGEIIKSGNMPCALSEIIKSRFFGEIVA